MRGIVVGVDGSEPSHRALAWAIEQGKLRPDVPITAVHAYRSPARRERSGTPYPAMRGPYLGADAVVQGVGRQQEWLDEAQRNARSAAESVLARTIREVTKDMSDVPRVEQHVVEREPARALVELSEGADTLVIGHRGKGGFKGLRLGSVSLKCAHHARCPVVVVR